MILTPNTSRLAQVDVLNYRDIISSNGGSISSTELQNIYKFAREIYSITGRQDFWLLRGIQNVGAGSYCYSFHGKVGTLINGPTWSDDGINSTGGNECISLPIQRTGVTKRTINFHVKANGIWFNGNGLALTVTYWQGFGNNGSGVFMGGAFSNGKPGTSLVDYTNNDIGLNNGNINFAGMTFNSGLQNTYKNGVFNSSSSAANSFPYNDTNNMYILRRPGADTALVGYMSFFMETTDVLDNQQSEIYKLFKNTIGHDLGLV